MRKLAIYAAGILLAAGLATSAHADLAPLEIEGATTLDADGVIELVTSTPSLVILDNRSQGDYDAGHIEGAVRLIDTDIASEADIVAHAAKDDPVLFYCNGLSCGRAANAVIKAVGYGYSDVYYYALGMEEWKERGLPLVSN
ncbi:rhodanese-like domain-containing protein [Salinarimonas rosea]|uniref:rhodanese-like domain-containing protein n=1 Tax=Salinarimonas rosea TaxID=552063 RepID=UPI00048CF72C|nr:rhodanese-like domain-containing protein [Salinarimonas rosea]